MKTDPLNQFINLRKSLLEEKAGHLARLTQIDRALGDPTAVAKPVPTRAPASAPAQPALVTEVPKRKVSKASRAKMAAAQKARWAKTKAAAQPTEPAKPALPAPASTKSVRRKQPGRIPGQPSLKAVVSQLTAAKPLTRGEIIAGLKKVGHKYAEGSLQFTLYKKGNFKRADGKFSPVG